VWLSKTSHWTTGPTFHKCKVIDMDIYIVVFGIKIYMIIPSP